MGGRGEPFERRNTVLFVAWGVEEGRLEGYVRSVERLEKMLVDLHPLFVVDSTAFKPIRDRGYPVEYIIPLDEWREHRASHEWGGYVAQRVSALREKHRPKTVVVLDGNSPVSPLDQGVLNSILLPELAQSEDNLLDR